MTHAHTPVFPCPWCGSPNDCVVGANTDEVPQAGDWGICYGCGLHLVYIDNLSTRKPTLEEQARMMADPEMTAVRHAWWAAQ